MPRGSARLLQHDAAIFRVGVVAEVRALIEKALALRIDHDAELVAVAFVAHAGVEIAKIRRIAVPGHGMAAGPLAIRLRADRQCHADAIAGVVTRAADLGHVPAGPEITCAPFAI